MLPEELMQPDDDSSSSSNNSGLWSSVLFGSVIQKVKETFSEDHGTQKRWRSSSLHEFKPSEDKKEYRKSITRDSDIFKDIVASARETVFLGENKKEYRHQTKNSDPG